MNEEEFQRYLKLERIENFKRNLYQHKLGEPRGHSHMIMLLADNFKRDL